MNVVINLNKARNISSQQAISEVKRVLGVRKAGHAGTLDPMATGVLVVCLNEATKIMRFLFDLEKEYTVRLKFGERTDTYDATGRIVEKRDCSSLKESAVRETLGNFLGETKQLPPMYSAVKIGGNPLYKLARRGIDIERPRRDIQISRIDLLSFRPPYLDFGVRCSKGTYIRTLCDDIGRQLLVGAHMVALTRTRVGEFGIEDSLPTESLGERKDAYLPMDSVLSHLDEVVLDADSYRKARNGVPIRMCGQLTLSFPDALTALNKNSVSVNRYVKLKSPERTFFGIGRVEAEEIRIVRLLNCSL